MSMRFSAGAFMALLFCLLVAVPTSPLPVVAQPSEYTAPLDSSRVAVKQIPASALEAYLEDQAFHYDRPPPTQGLWDRFTAWLREWLGRLLMSYGTSDVWDYVFYSAAVLFAVWLVYQIFQSNFSGVLYRRSSGDRSEARILDQADDIHEIDYEKRIQEAVAARQYRMAVRLYYLHALKTLADRRLIDWKIDKTNHDYLREMADSPLRQPFAEMTRGFEYAWYGDMPLDETAFQQLQQRFQQFQGSLSEG